MPSYSTTASAVQSALSASLSISYPSGTALGDLLLVYAAVRDFNGAGGVTAPSGFTLLATGSPGTSDASWLYGRIADGTESGTVSFDTNTTGGQFAFMLRFPAPVGYAWPVIATAHVGTTESSNSASTTTNMRLGARTVTSNGNLGIQFGKKPTTGAVTALTPTSGWTQATYGWNSTVNAVFTAQFREISGNITDNDLTPTGNTATNATGCLTAEFAPVMTSIVVSVDDSTPEPTQAVVITKSGGNWNGTPTATLTDNNGSPVAMPALTSVSGAVATLTLGAGSINNYDDSNATWELIRWNQLLTLTVTDSDGSGDTTLTITPPVDDHFDSLGASGVYVTSPGTSGDDSYVHIVSGDGEGLPVLADLQGNTVPTVARFLCFDVSADKWLAQIEHTFDVTAATLDGEYADAFTGTNGTLITAHTPTTDTVGGGYTIEKDVSTAAAVSNAVTIQSNRLYINDANEGMVKDVGTVEPDFSFDWVCATGKEFVAQVRRVDDTEHIHMYVKQSDGLVRLNERVASANIGMTGTRETTHTFVDGTTYRFRIYVVGLVVTVYIDDVQILQPSSTRTGESHATKVGLFAAGAGTFPAIFDNANVYSDYVAGLTLSLSDETPNPGDVITVTVGGGVLANTSYTGTLNGVSVTLGSKTTGGCTVTIPDYAQYDASGTMVNAGFYRNLTLELNDGTNTPTTTLQIVPDDADSFGTVGADELVHAPVGTKTGDDCYVRVLTGSATTSPETCDATGFYTADFMVFDTVGEVWLAKVSVEELIDFSRTEYIPDAPASRNLLKWSNGFGNAAWTKTGCSITSRAASYTVDGETVWFDRIVENGSTSEHLIQCATIYSVTSDSHVCQLLVKANGRTDMYFRLYGNNTANRITIRVNLSAGTITEETASGTATFTDSTIEDKGSGVYKITLIGIAESTNASSFFALRIQMINSSTTYAGDSTSGVDIARCQLARGSEATPYIHTETVPLRSDQMIVRAQGAHNLVPYSNDLSNAAWTKTRSAAPGTSLALSGSASGGWAGATLYKFREDSTASATHSVQAADNSILLNPSGLVTARFVAASDGGQDRHVQINVYGDSYSNYFNYRVNLVTGAVLISAVTGTAALHSISVTQVDTVTIEGTGSCPVWEIVVRGWPTTTSDSAQQSLLFYVTDASGNVSYTGDGTSGIYLGKIQVVSGYDLPDYAETTTADPLFADVVSSATLNSVAQGVALDALILQTEDQTQTTPWTRTNIHAVTAEGVSADGYPAYKIDCNTTSGGHSIGIAAIQKTLTDNTLATFFVDAKADERAWVSLGARTKANAFPGKWFNLSTGATGTTNGTLTASEIESRGGGWYRMRIVMDVASGGTTPGFAIYIGEADNDGVFAGLGANDGLLVSRCFAVEGNVAMADADAAYVRAGSTMEYVRDRSSAIVTMPGIDEFDAAGDHVATQWYEPQTLAITDGSTTITGSTEIEPYIPANFGTVGSSALAFDPTGTQPGDDCYIRVLTGTATTYPATCNIVGTGTGEVMVFNIATGEWLDTYEVSSFTEAGNYEVVRTLLRPVVRSIFHSVVN